MLKTRNFLILLLSFLLVSCSFFGNEPQNEYIDRVSFLDEQNGIRGDIVVHKNYEIAVEGEARWTWYFEAEFGVAVMDDNNNLLSQWYVMTDQEWMTTDYVPFMWEISYVDPETEYWYVVFSKANPSWLEELDEKVSVRVKIK